MLAVILASAIAFPQCALRATSLQTTGRVKAAEQQQDRKDLWRSYLERLPVGSTVKVTFKDGRRMKAILMAVQEDRIVIKPKTRVPEPERTVAIDAIEMLELANGGGMGAGKAAAIGIASGAGAAVGILLLLIAAYSGS